jgi:hypothetical protein
LNKERPAVDHYKEQQLERQGYRNLGDHHHTHSEKYITDDNSYRYERQIDEKANLKRLGKFGNTETGD